jgi:hypothetical protein
MRVLSEAEIKATPPAPNAAIKKLRFTHHLLARLLAAGLRDGDAGLRAGYSASRVSILKKDPSFANLVKSYAESEDLSFYTQRDEYYDLLMANGLRAEGLIADRLDAAESGDDIPTRELIAIARDAADRVGYGKRQTNVNVNIDFAARLDRAIKRSGKDMGATPEGDGRLSSLPHPVDRRPLVIDHQPVVEPIKRRRIA